MGSRVGRSATVSGLVLSTTIACVCLLVSVWAASARASATPGPSPLPGPTGLPNGRVYEQASPTSKNGNGAGVALGAVFGLARADGDAVVYPMTGPVGTATAGIVTEFVSRRSPGTGWQTASTTPHPTFVINLGGSPLLMVPSADFSRFLFQAGDSFVADDPAGTNGSGVNLFLSEDPFVEPAWLGRPQTPDPTPALGTDQGPEYDVAGESADLKTVYFTYRGTLLPQDSSRAPYVRSNTGQYLQGDTPWGFYEWSEGRLVPAGVLPDGSINPFGAVPAAIAGDYSTVRTLGAAGATPQAETMDNEVSEDGSRAFFVSPDPVASTVTDSSHRCASEPPCSPEPSELYLREPGPSGQKVSVLVSASALPGHEGEPAPDGVIAMPNAPSERSNGGTDIYASPDGSHALFASNDQLTSAAPSDSEVKIYDYDVATGSLTYLPGVSAPIAGVSRDGSTVLFEDRTVTPNQLKLWRQGPGGGSVITIVELSGNVDNVHITDDGSVVVFRSDATIPGGFNNSGGFNQAYRYDVAADELDCVSCPPQPSAPSGEIRMSYNNEEKNKGVTKGTNSSPGSTIETRAMSSDGSRIFFDSPDALVPQDTNGVRDVYEWEAGKVYLISSGANKLQSIYVDNDVSGENVFFATAASLVPGDNGEDYDVYDARVPRPGDTLQGATPCKGSVCQGPPSVPSLLGAPASETFEGAGNASPAPAGRVVSKGLTRKQKLERALRACGRQKGARARARCRRRARARYGAKAAGAGSDNGNRHNGRGK